MHPSLKIASAGAAALLLLQACVSTPSAPRVMVIPDPNKPPEIYAQDREICRQFAEYQTVDGAHYANRRRFGTAVLGTIFGAALGAAIGGGRGAWIGAASGAAAGTVAGVGETAYARRALQRRYDMIYARCMYDRGNQVPGYAPRGAPPPPPPPE